MREPARSYDVIDLADGDDKDISEHRASYIEVINDAATDALVKINDHEGQIPVKAGTSKEIAIRTFRIRVSGAAVKVICYFL